MHRVPVRGKILMNQVAWIKLPYLLEVLLYVRTSAQIQGIGI